MKSFIILNSLLVLFHSNSFCQTGIYQYESKSSKEDVELNLRRDGVFFYTYNKEWTNCITQGTWKPLGYGKIVLNSDFQLDGYTVQELEEPNIKGVHLIIQSKGKGQSPTTISKLYANDSESNKFELDGEAGLAMLEQRQRMISAASTAVRDSLTKSDPPRFYMYLGGKTIKKISMEFDLKKIDIEIKNPKANKIILTTAFAPNAAYHYMKEVEFAYDDKFIWQTSGGMKLKRVK